MVFEARTGASSASEPSTAAAAGVTPGKASRADAAGVPPAKADDPAAEVQKLLGGKATADAAHKAYALIKAMDPAAQTAVITKIGNHGRDHLASKLTHAEVAADDDHAVLRRCFDATPAGEVATLSQWVALRFHLKVTKSTDAHGAAWDKNGLRRSWDVLDVLPADHVENNGDLSSLTRYRAGDIEGWASDDGEAAIGYGKNKLDTELEVGAFTDKQDPLFGQNIFDATVRHEIGHRVDAKVGGPNYTKSDDGGGWLTWESSANMANRFVNGSGGKISAWSDAGERTAIIHALQQVIDARTPQALTKKLEALPFVAKHKTDPAQQAKLDEIKGDKAIGALRKAFADTNPWDDGGDDMTLGGRVYQESYAGQEWVSYKQAARAKKFSRYQFRAPGEWFAEAYATYYQPPGEKGALMKGLDETTRKWFDAHVDPQHGKGGTTAKAAPGATPTKPAGGGGGK
ncbi:MAG TPA: hypothetical protein VFP84_11040 [Kofleriaceae bacterium]|nr:hypothetical protein [Kofleriaceae bacterium]